MRQPTLALLLWLVANGNLASAGGDDSRWQAQTHHKSGQRLYDAGAYESAALEFAEAYRLSGSSALLFNVGQAYRLAGKCLLARDFYTRYRDQDPRAIERTNVVERIAEMERCIAQQPASGQPAPPSSPAPEPSDAIQPTTAVARSQPIRSETSPLPAVGRRAPTRDGSGRRWSGGILASGGALLAGTGVYLWLRAVTRADELSHEFATGGEWSSEAGQREDAIDRDRGLGMLFTGIGGLAITTGTVLYWSGRERGAAARRIAITPTTGGAEIACSWDF